MKTFLWMLGLLWGLSGLISGLLNGKGHMLRNGILLGPLAFFLLRGDD
jgi:hypothetical protein